MADVTTTLHPEGQPEDNLYPNVKLENLPEDIRYSGEIVYNSYKEQLYQPTQATTLDSFTITTPGNYVISGYMETTVGYSASQELEIKVNGSYIVLNRGTGDYGGGRVVTAIYPLTAGDTVVIESYGYYSGSCYYKSRLSIIRVR